MTAATSPEPYVEQVGLDPTKIPRHIAIIMDGNGRWARAQGQPRVAGHLQGVQVVRTIVEECSRLGVGQLTLYCFSSENWKRPQQELDFLMALLKEYLVAQRPELMENNLRFAWIGRRTGLPDEVLRELEESVRHCSRNTGMTLCLAINYGGRQEIVDAVRAIAERVGSGELKPDDIDEVTISDALSTGNADDPDLLIRTAGEMRVSNFLLWQISYAELWVTPTFWPEFHVGLLHQALRDFASRERRFGGLKV